MASEIANITSLLLIKLIKKINKYAMKIFYILFKIIALHSIFNNLFCRLLQLITTIHLNLMIFDVLIETYVVL